MEVFCIGWWFGFAYFSTSLYWFAFPLLVEASKFAWLIPFAVFGLAALLALYFSANAVIFYTLQKYGKVPSILAFAVTFTCTEWVLGHLFTGFPWNIIGYAWGFSNEIMQITSIIGIYGLTFITILFIAGIADLILLQRNYFLSVISIMIMIGIYLWGGNRLNNNPTEYWQDVNLRLVQANISQKMNINPQYSYKILEKYIELSIKPAQEKLSYVIWPEGAVNFMVNNDLIESIRSRVRLNIIFGANRIDADKVFNTLYVVGDGILKHYDKRHLVPFGEYIPLRTVLAMDKVISGHQNFSSNVNQARNITISGLPTFVPSICYEAIFPNEVVMRSETPKAEWMLNITNDAWFGTSIEPYQHLEMARIRAIEEGMPLVRATNAGIPAVIDSYGRLVKTLPLKSIGIMDVQLPKGIGVTTIYSKIADYLDWLIIIATIMVIIYALYLGISRGNISKYGR